MGNWKPVMYRNRELRNQEDCIWAAEEIRRRVIENKLENVDIAMLSILKDKVSSILNGDVKEYNDLVEKNPIKNRFEILDIRDDKQKK